MQIILTTSPILSNRGPVAGTVGEITCVVSDAPALMGTPKQTAWASKIRAEVLADLGATIVRQIKGRNGLSAAITPRDAAAFARDLDSSNHNLATIATWLSRATSAAEWIEEAAAGHTYLAAQRVAAHHKEA